MTTTGYEVTGAIIISVVALAGKVIEHAHLFHAVHSGAHKSIVPVYYECANWHLHLSLGMLGLAWSQHWDAAYCGPLFPLIIIGALLKGIIASPKVATLRFTDPTAFLGLYLPNILAFVCVAWALFGRDITAHDGTSTLSSVTNSVVTNAIPPKPH